MNQEKTRELEKTIREDYGNIAGIVVQRNGVTRYENYFNGFTADDAVHVASVTKSIFSALIGIAIDQGHIKGVGQRVLDFFPDYAARPGEKAAGEVTLENLLTMTAPYTFQAEPFEAFFTSDNWVKAALDFMGGEHTGAFLYSPIIGAHILSGILTNATGRPVLDFAMENLFSPLGIRVKNVAFRDVEEQIAWYSKEKHATGWVVDPQGLNTASWGLTLTPMDMAKIGQLYLDDGIWEGRQIIPANWITASTRTHVQWNGLSYGYLWWVLDENERCFAAMGDGGNVIYVNEKKKLVVAVASFLMPDARDRIDLIREHIEPRFAE